MPAPFYAAYAGPSMHPTLREPDLLEIERCGTSPLRVGDVAFFLPPQFDEPVVHRVVRATPEGLITRGDNNCREDAFLVQPQHVQGRVVAAWRGRERRTIVGGRRGRLAGCWCRWRRSLDRAAAPLLRPLYRTLARRGVIARLVPGRLRPRVVVFRGRGRERFHLLMGKLLIGSYDDHREQWLIRRPFRVFVAGALLAGGPPRADRGP